MTIAIDASRSIDTIQKTGVEKVSDELLAELKTQLTELREKIDPIFYTPQVIDWLPQANQKILPWPFKFFWTQIRLAWELIFHPPAVMLFPVHAMPLLLFFTHYSLRITRYYKIIHDIAFKKQPQLYSFKQKIILNLDLWLAKKLCAKIFVPTNAVKDDLIKYAKINHEKIVVTHWGYNTKNTESTKTQKARKQILYIGRIEEKKNIANLIKAFGIFHQKYPDYELILTGKIDPSFKSLNIKFQISNQYQNPNEKNKNHNSSFIIHHSIKFLGYISEEKKYQLLRESVALVHVPFEEGFGFPLLEAFDFALPVVASDIPVLREIGGEACLYVNPGSPADIARGLELAVAETGRDPFLSKIEKGRARLKNFSWPLAAAKILSEITG